MTRRFLLVVTLGSLGACGMSVRPGKAATLLATMDAGGAIGTPQVIDSMWPVLFYMPSTNPDVVIPLFEQFTLLPQFPVSIENEVSVDNDVDFDAFTTMLTDGVDQFVLIGGWCADSGLVGAGGGQESFDLDMLVPAYGPDLIGYEIDYIRQIGTVNLESPGSDLYGDGIWTDWEVSDGRYEFYGHVVPEPCSLVLLSPLLLPMIRRVRKARPLANATGSHSRSLPQAQ